MTSAADLGPKVRVNIIHPGATETEALEERQPAEAQNDAPTTAAAMQLW